MLKSGIVILLETKGDDRDNADTAAKLDLGRTWSGMAGSGYRYMMVFKTPK
jgi:type III restriction enzyme